MALNDLSGQITVATAGTAVQGPNVRGNSFAIKARPDNTDTAWVGNVSGDVSATTGFALDPGETLPIQISNLNLILFDVDVSGEKICWIRMTG